MCALINKENAASSSILAERLDAADLLGRSDPMVSTPGRKPARKQRRAPKLTRGDLTVVEPDIAYAVAHKISLFEGHKSIRQVRNCDLALIVSITLDYAVEALRLAREETTA
jgi:hypothetical protein